MKLGILAVAAVLAMALMVTTASAGSNYGGGTGTCPSPNMQDADGDGIPNHLDPDYTRPQDGSGRQLGWNVVRVAGPFGNLPCLIPDQTRLRIGRFTGFGPADGRCTPFAPKDGTGFGGKR